MTSHVCEDFGFEAEFAYYFAVFAGLFRAGGVGQLDILDAEGIQCLGDAHFGFRVEKGIGELLALSQCALDDLHVVRIV